jgi:hypothetical protein
VSLLLAGCFSDVGNTDEDTGDATATGAGTGTTAASTSVTGADAAGSMSGGATTFPSDDDTSTTAPTTESSSPSEAGSSSESDTGDESFCESQPSEVVVCHDFDGVGPLAGASIWEQHGTLDVSETRAVSEPRSMEVVATGDPAEGTNVSMGRTLAGVRLPFAGELSAQAWLDAACFTLVGGGPERLLMALQFVDNGAATGPFLLNLTLWVTSEGSTLYVSDEGQGFPSQPYPLGIPFPSEAWVAIAIVFDASDNVASVTVGEDTEMVPIDLVTEVVTQEIATVAPSISIGTAMGPGVPGCTMWFDDVRVALH